MEIRFILFPSTRDLKEDNTNKVALQNRNRDRQRQRERLGGGEKKEVSTLSLSL